MTTQVRSPKWERLIHKLSLCLVLTAMDATLLACSNKPRLANHSFTFDAPNDSPDIKILDWRYGTSRHLGAKGCPEDVQTCPIVGQYVYINGPMRVGDDLYVKWKVKSTNEVFEANVDLRDKNPRELEGHTIRFIAHHSQVYVYLITPTKLSPNPCPSDGKRLTFRKSDIPDERVFSLYCSRLIFRLHPVGGTISTFN